MSHCNLLASSSSSRICCFLDVDKGYDGDDDDVENENEDEDEEEEDDEDDEDEDEDELEDEAAPPSRQPSRFHSSTSTKLKVEMSSRTNGCD